jgi:leucyl aminopeptidase
MKNPVNLNIEITTSTPQPKPYEAIAVCVFEDAPHVAHEADQTLARVSEEVVRGGEFKGQADTSLFFYASDGTNHSGTRRLLLLGMGSRADFDHTQLRRAAGMAVREAHKAHVRHLYFLSPQIGEAEKMVSAVSDGALFGLYDGGLYQKHDEEETSLSKLTIITNERDDDLKAEIERGRLVAEAVNWARELADEPGATLPPREFARRAQLMAEEFGLQVESLDAGEIKARGMGALRGVGQGSDEQPALIVVRYEPGGASADDELWAFVGKGITFDSGGLSLKKPEGMEEMKSDMAGGAAVLGALRAIAQIKPQQRIVGIIPSAENMPSGRAIKPGDVVKTLAGYTIEVVDTDAEGRLVLVDGIAYAKQLGASRIVDLATLTGSIIVALGEHRTGLFSNDDAWANRVTEAAERAGEPVWRMPVSDDYKKRIESPVADFKNYGGRPDATAAALLLSKFAGETPWVHLDIAGTAWFDDPQPHAPKGTTGTGVRTLVELACGLRMTV